MSVLLEYPRTSEIYATFRYDTIEVENGLFIKLFSTSSVTSRILLCRSSEIRCDTVKVENLIFIQCICTLRIFKISQLPVSFASFMQCVPARNVFIFSFIPL